MCVFCGNQQPKKKKRLVSIDVLAYDLREPKSPPRFVEEIQIRDGIKFVKEISHDKLVDEEGNVLRIWDWQAGYSVLYKFYYETE